MALDSKQDAALALLVVTTGVQGMASLTPFIAEFVQKGISDETRFAFLVSGGWVVLLGMSLTAITDSSLPFFLALGVVGGLWYIGTRGREVVSNGGDEEEGNDDGK